MGMTTLRRFLIKHDIQHNASLFEKLIESPMGKKKTKNLCNICFTHDSLWDTAMTPSSL